MERDPVTGYPTINASGVKGALRQFFEENAKDLTVRLFGSPVHGSKNDASTPGSLKILSAQMLGRPARASQGTCAYYMTTTKLALEQLCTTSEALGCGLPFTSKNLQKTENYHSTAEPVAVEGYPVGTALPDEPENKEMKNYLKNCFGGDFLILSDEVFRKLPLPVVARNQLENGESQNLWYEEYVPHESVFWFAVLGSDEDLSAFDTAVGKNVIQFGGNASIGCGLCTIKRGGTTNVKAED